MEVIPTELEGSYVRLELPGERHVPDLVIAGQSDEIWDFIPFGPFRTTEEMRAWLFKLLERMEEGDTVPFVIVRRADGHAVGMTSYMDIRPSHRGLEIGGTWLSPSVWRTEINSECKYLLLRHAFETIGAIRVQLKTDGRNVRSQRAIERLGAVKEGVLRKHLLTRGDFIRDTVMYSILDSEWPNVKAKLERGLYPEQGRL